MTLSSRSRRDYLVFTALFCVVGLLVFSTYLYVGKSFIWSTGVDGINQHYPALMYEGMWLRDIAKSFLAGHPEVKLWDYHIGYGSDVLTTMSYYAFGDPLNLLSAVVPTRYTELLYNALAVARLWLAGLAFVLFCHKMEFSGTKVVAGALAYAFSGYATYVITRHPFFCNPLIYLPLLLTGVERVYRDHRPALYMVAIFLAALSNYYFFYMLALCVAIYAVCRFFTLPHKNVVVDFVVTGVSFVVLSLVGVACAAFLLLPTLSLLLSNNRAHATLLYESFYDIKYYQRFIPSFFSVTILDRWKLLGFAGPVLLGVTCLLADRRRHPFLLVAFLLMVAMLLVPAVGSVFNGLSYVTNRWTFIVTLFVCMMLVLEWDTLVEDPAAQAPGMVVVAVCVVLSFGLSVNYGNGRGAFLSLSLYLVSLLLLVALPRLSDVRLVATPRARGLLLTALIAVGLYANAYCLYSPRGESNIDEEIDAGTALQAVTETASRIVRDVADEAGTEGLVRVDMDSYWENNPVSGAGHPTRNTSIFAGVSSTQYYWSVVNAGTSQYMLDLQMPSILSQKVLDLDSRIMPITLAAVNYEVVKKSMVPYGYEPIAEGSRIFTSPLSLPVGYTYDAVLPASSLDDSDATVKQEAMMQAAVVSDDDFSQLKGKLAVAEPDYQAQTCPVEVSLVGDIARIDDTHYLARKGACLEFRFEGVEKCETYLKIEGLQAEPRSDYQLYHDSGEPLSPEQFDALPLMEQRALRWTDATTNHWTNNEYEFTVYMDGGKTKTLTWHSPYAQWSDNANDFVVNLGYHDEAQTVCAIGFPRTGLYTIEDIKIVCQPMDGFAEHVEALRQDVLEDTWYGTNSFGGTITLEEPKLLCLAMPNEKGWTATVDGQKASIVTVNTMFMGLMLEPGTHEVRLSYCTNLLPQGLLISLGGFALLVAIALLSHRVGGTSPDEGERRHHDETDGPNAAKVS